MAKLGTARPMFTVATASRPPRRRCPSQMAGGMARTAPTLVATTQIFTWSTRRWVIPLRPDQLSARRHERRPAPRMRSQPRPPGGRRTGSPGPVATGCAPTGVRIRPSATRRRSRTTAINTERPPPRMISVTNCRSRPSLMKAPYPPRPTRAVTVTSPIVVTVAMRMPGDDRRHGEGQLDPKEAARSASSPCRRRRHAPTSAPRRSRRRCSAPGSGACSRRGRSRR